MLADREAHEISRPPQALSIPQYWGPILALNTYQGYAGYLAALVSAIFVAVSGFFIRWLKKDGERLRKDLLMASLDQAAPNTSES